LIDNSEESINKAKDVLMSLEGKIPFLRHIEVGVDVVRSARSYDLALVAKFDSLKDLDAYQVHPEHVEVLEYIGKVKKESVAVDYEIN
jgi:hypothetical protein